MSGRRRPRAQKKRAGKPRTLRTRLVVASVTLIAVVCAVIGTVTTLALRSHLYGQLDGQLNESASRASGSFGPPGGQQPKGGLGAPGGKTQTGAQARAEAQAHSTSLTDFVTKGPQPQGTIIAKVVNGSITDARRGVKQTSDLQMTPKTLTKAQIAALGSVPQDNKQHTVDIPGVGDFRVEYKTGDSGSYYVAVPTAEVDNTINTLILVELSVTGAGLVAAAIAGYVLVGVATRPLRRVASTATRVSELPSTPAKSPSTNASPSPRPTRTPRSARSAPRSTGCSTTSTAPCTPDSRARCGYGSSWPTPVMSCGRPSPPSGDTPS